MEMIDQELLKALDYRRRCKLKFLVALIVFQRILSYTKSLSDQLQSKEMNFAKTADLVLATVERSKEFRSDTQWTAVFNYVKGVADQVAINAEISHRYCRKVSHAIQNSIVLESTGVRDVLSPSTNFIVFSSNRCNTVQVRPNLF